MEETMEKLKLEGNQDLLSLYWSKNDQWLQNEFNKWATKNGKKFSSNKQRNKMFQIYCDFQNKVAEYKRTPPSERSSLLSFSDSDQSMRIKFDKLSRGKKYSSDEMREESFRLFCYVNKKTDSPSVDHTVNKSLDDEDLKTFSCLKKIYDKYDLRYQSSKLDNMFLGHDLLSENDDELMRPMFDVWAIKHDRIYSSEEEREKRFKIFCRSKKIVDYKNSQNSSCTYALNNFADRGAPLMPIRHVVQRMYALKLEKEDNEETKEARVEFDKWATKHGRVYCNEEESQKRFSIFMVNRKLFKPFKEDNPECWIQLGCDKLAVGLDGIRGLDPAHL